jgi:hypothetical protein
MINLELNNTVLTILREFISEVLDQERKLDAMYGSRAFYFAPKNLIERR